MAWAHLAVKGRVRVVVRDLSGRVLQRVESSNLVVQAGRILIADWIIGRNYSSGLLYVGVGSSNQAPALTDSDLIQPIGSRKQATDRFRTQNVATISTFFGSQDNNGVWRETGLFDAQSGGVMFARAVFSPEIVKDQSKTVTVDWDIEVT
jgi:hypothetical protein